MRIEEIYQCFLQCDSVSTDTRKIEPNTLFIALKGENFDANTFAAEAIAKGALFVIIDNKKYQTDQDKMLLVPDSLQALQELANYHRKQLGLPIIALTGSNGKTTTKELIYAVLSKKYNTKATIGNLNNHIGVPLTLLSFTEDTDIGIVEMGANHQKEIELLCQITEPDFGYITNFGKAHLEGFGGIEGVIKGKCELYTYLQDNLKTVFVNTDDSIQLERTKNIQKYTFGSSISNANIKIQDIVANPFVCLTLADFTIQSNLIGLYNANNIAAAITIGTYFNVPEIEIKHAIENYTPTNNRSQLIKKNTNQIILDAYNANPSSMQAALNNFTQLEGTKKIAILGDMFELGTESAEEHQKIVSSLKNKWDINFYFIGSHFYNQRITESNFYFFENFEAFKSFLIQKTPIQETTILIKGSRGMALEKTLDLL